MSKYGVISGPYFPVFNPNTGKYGPEITPYLDTFHASKQPSFFPKIVPISGIVEADCKGFITPGMNLEPPLLFKFSLESCTLDYLLRVFTGKGLAGDPC